MTRRRIRGVMLCLALVCALPIAIPSVAFGAFGVTPGGLDATAVNANGSSDTQAGSHPFAYVVHFAFNANAEGAAEGSVRNIVATLPVGLIGNRGSVPRCPRADLEGTVAKCPGDTQIGTTKLQFAGPHGEGDNTLDAPLYNLDPPAGFAASFGFEAGGFNAIENASVVEREHVYRIAVSVQNVERPYLLNVTQTIWGVPAEAGHDAERTCVNREGYLVKECPSEATPVPFLTLPTSCDGPLALLLEVSSSVTPNDYLSQSSLSGGETEPLSGCELLAFEPAVKLAPDTTRADTPAGLTAEVKMAQDGLMAPGGLSAADLKNTVVTLPDGVAINPGQAAGLEACPYSKDGVGSDGPAECPNGSQVGTVKIKTPLLEEELEGDAYILPANPPNLELLVAAKDPAAGIYIKMIGHVHLDEETGRITTTFNETPQLPFSSFKLSFNGGAQAALVTPTQCGIYTSQADFKPWSTPFEADQSASDSFAIAAGTGGAPCPPTDLPFTPELIAGATNDQAGAFTGFSMLVRRPDDQQRVSTLSFKAPPGLSGEISKVTLCQEPQAAAGDCPAGSQIGHTVVEAGPGPYPLVIPENGRAPDPIYLTGPYKGAPYGLSIVTNLLVGPFNLGTIVTRAKIEVDPVTTQLTVTTDPLPQTVGGVPSDLRTIDAVIDRPQFMLNPTNCDESSFSGSATSIEGAAGPYSSRFEVGSCRSLQFTPSFKATASGRTTKAYGTSLHASISFPKGSLGEQANIHEVKVELPRQLPVRQSTLPKACLGAQFDANPAGCSKESIVGHAKAITPILPVPLEGPAYFVSHGGAGFPDLDFVLQGDGVTVVLHGETFIGKDNIISTTFKTVPDQPVSSFELTLPKGPYSALTNNGNLCHVTKTVAVKKKVRRKVKRHFRTVTRKVRKKVAAKLVMPTTMIAQNGLEMHQNTVIAVSECGSKAKAKKAGHKHSRKARHKRRG